MRTRQSARGKWCNCSAYPSKHQHVKEEPKTKEASVEYFNLPSGKLEQHTPTPWHVGVKQAGIIIYDEKGWAIADCKVFHGNESGEPKANAAFIVRAVNSHEALLETLKTATQWLERCGEKASGDFIKQAAYKVIAQAEKV